MTDRWIKLWCSIDDDPEFAGDGYKRDIFLLICRKANWEDGKKPLPRQKVIVKRGQWPASLRDIQTLTGFRREIIIDRLRQLEESGTIARDKGFGGSIITVCKYNYWQESGPLSGPQSGPLSGPQSGPINRRVEGQKGRTNTPHTPKGGRVSDKQCRQRAGLVIAKLSGIMFRGDPEPEARKKIGEAGWAAIIELYGSWRTFTSRLSNALNSDTGGQVFLARLKQDITALYIDEASRSPKGLRVVRGGTAAKDPPGKG